MHQRLTDISDALAATARSGGLDGRLSPAMWGCPDCGTASMIASPVQAADCPDCAGAMSVLTAAQVTAALRR